MTPATREVAPVGSPAWPHAPAEIRLDEHDLHIWCASVDDFRNERSWLEALLSDDERERAGTYHFAADRDRFVTSRGVLRALLAGYVHHPAATIAFNIGRYGKPEIAAPRSRRPLHFSVSHAGALSVYAVTPLCPVGVDIERVREIPDCEAIASRYFAEVEAGRLMAAPRNRRIEEFVACWTRTEACVKATGEGIGADRRFHLPSEWHLDTLWPAPGYVGAVAYRLDAARLTRWTVSKEVLCRSQSSAPDMSVSW